MDFPELATFPIGGNETAFVFPDFGELEPAADFLRRNGFPCDIRSDPINFTLNGQSYTASQWLFVEGKTRQLVVAMSRYFSGT